MCYVGISAGCADVYGDHLDCQWIDISDVPLGTYTFKVGSFLHYITLHPTIHD